MTLMAHPHPSEVERPQGIPTALVPNKEPKFPNHFCRTMLTEADLGCCLALPTLRKIDKLRDPVEASGEKEDHIIET